VQNQSSAFLLVEKGAPYDRGKTFRLSISKTTIGRVCEDCHPDISFTSPYISRDHLQIKFEKGCYYAVDQVSKHGTKINGSRICQTKPYELKDGDCIRLAENEAVLVFSSVSNPETLNFPEKTAPIEVTLDTERREFHIDGHSVKLTGNLYALFEVLFQHKGCVVSHVKIKQAVWSERERDEKGQPLVEDDEVTTLIRRLREKLGPYEQLICNIRGYGYLLDLKAR
jgi:pSer/pThr/pTyr-binding forkhead associated (FHA) protein